MGGYATVRDGGGGVFYWDSSSSTGDNGGTIIVPTGSTTGRWLRVYTGNLSVRWFGAKGDGTTDDTTAIQNTINACSTAGGGTVFLPNGTYIVSGTGGTDAGCLYPATSTRLIGESREGTVIKLKASQPSFTRPIVLLSVNDVAIQNLTIDGNKANQAVEEHRAGIFIDSSARTYLADLNIHDCTGDAVDYYQNSTDFVMERCYCHDNARKGVTIDAGGQQFAVIRDCRFTNNAGSLHIEVQLPVYNILIEGCFCDKNVGDIGWVLSFSGAGPGIANHTRGVIVRDCQINGAVQAAHYASNVRIVHNRITPDSGVDSIPILVNLECFDVVIEDNEIYLPSNTNNVVAIVELQGALDGANYVQPDDIRIIGNRLHTGQLATNAIQLINTKSVQVIGNSFYNDIGHNSGAALAVSVSLTQLPTDTVLLQTIA